MPSASISQQVGIQPAPGVANPPATGLPDGLPGEVNSIPGQGALQGRMVAVGDGQRAAALRQDVLDTAGVDADTQDVLDAADMDADMQHGNFFEDRVAHIGEQPAAFAIGPDARGAGGMPGMLEPDALELEAIKQEWLSLLDKGVKTDVYGLQPSPSGFPDQRQADEARLQLQNRSVLERLADTGQDVLVFLDRCFNPQAQVPPADGAGNTNRLQAQAGAAARNSRDRHIAEARALIVKIDAAFQRLNEQLRIEAGAPLLPRDPDRLDWPEPGLDDSVWRAKHTLFAGVAALQSMLAKTTGALVVPAAASVVSPLLGPIAGLALQGAAASAAAYLCFQSMREFPGLMSSAKVSAMIRETLGNTASDRARLELLQEQESTQHVVEMRSNLEGFARLQMLCGLAREIHSVNQVLMRATPAPDQRVRVGEGGRRAQMLGLAARARAAFHAFFAPVAKALRQAYAYITDPMDLSRRRALAQERAYATRIQSTLKVLHLSANDSLVHGNGLEVHAMERAIEAGAGIDYLMSRQRFIMGENLARALLSAPGQSFGVLAYEGGNEHGGRRAVSSTVATARAIAWYLDAIADLPEPVRATAPGTPEVRRNADGSLSVADPQRQLYNFLLSVPQAYNATIAQGEALAPGISIDDPAASMPRGMHALKFDAGMDLAMQAGELRLWFAARSESPVYHPLANEAPKLYQMQVALYIASSAPATVEDYSNWPMPRLEAHYRALLQQWEAASAVATDQNLLNPAVEAWVNPRLVSRHA